MKNKINFLCSILVLFCLISMYIPVIAPRYSAKEYHAAEGGYEKDYFFTGDYYLANRYWSITDYAFAEGNPVIRILISLTQAMLVIRAWLIVSGQADRKKEWIAGAVNLAVTGFLLGKMMISMWSCRWGVFAIMVLLMITSIVMSAYVEHTAG